MKIIRTAGLTAGLLFAGFAGHFALEASRAEAVPNKDVSIQTTESNKLINLHKTIVKQNMAVQTVSSAHVSSLSVLQPVSGTYVTTVNLHVRSHPSTNDSVLGILKKGTVLAVQGKLSNGWYQINYRGKKGYVSGQYIVQPNTVFKMNVPIVLQRPQLPTGCEVTSLTMALNYKGVKVDKVTLAKKMPYTSTFDPNKGFVGSPFKTSGETINPVSLQRLAKAYRSRSEDLTGASMETIEKEVRAGNPVLAWYTLGYVEPKNKYLTRNGHRYWFPQPLHCIVVTGASPSYFYINDPWNGNKNYAISKERFNRIYTKMGKRALVVR